MIEPGSNKKGSRIVFLHLIWQNLWILRTKAVITSFSRNFYQSNSKAKKYQVVKKNINALNPNKSKYIKFLSYSISLKVLSLYMFSPASLIELSVVKVLTPHHSGFQGQPLLHSSGQEMRVSSKLELKITTKTSKPVTKIRGFHDANTCVLKVI